MQRVHVPARIVVDEGLDGHAYGMRMRFAEFDRLTGGDSVLELQGKLALELAGEKLDRLERNAELALAEGEDRLVTGHGNERMRWGRGWQGAGDRAVARRC